MAAIPMLLQGIDFSCTSIAIKNTFKTYILELRVDTVITHNG